MNLTADSAALVRKIIELEGTISKLDGDRGEVEALVNTTGVIDRQKDLMSPGCFARVIEEHQEPAICWAHDVKRIVGKVIAMREYMPGTRPDGAEGGALWIKAVFALATQAGRDAFELVRGGFVKQWSVQFWNDPADEEQDFRKGIRIVKQVGHLFEVSPVLAGASPATLTLSAKDARSRSPEALPLAPSGPPYIVDPRDEKGRFVQAPVLIAEMAEDRAWDQLTAAEDAAWQTRYELQQSIAKTAENVAFCQLQNSQRGFGLDDPGRVKWSRWRRLRGL